MTPHSITIIVSVTALLFIQFFIITADAEVYCFELLHRRPNRRNRDAVCKQPMVRPRKLQYKSVRGCCQKGGVGYSTTFSPIGSKQRKFVCTECPDKWDKPRNRNSISTSNLSASSTYTPLWTLTTLSSLPSTPISNLRTITAEQTTPFAPTITRVSTTPVMAVTSATPPASTVSTAHTTTTTPTTTTLTTPTTTSVVTEPLAGWSDWGLWSACSVTCTVGNRRRERTCYGGACTGNAEDYSPCSLSSDCPVDGGWGPWYSWTECSDTCGGGKRVRNRHCIDPPPQHNGLPCPGQENEEELCNTRGCPVDGGWSEWQVIQECSVTCGKGSIIQRRECNNPPPQHGGADCEGDDQNRTRCERAKCPRHGDWSLWSRWSDCDVSCGNGTRSRQRECNAPAPKFGGRNCTGLTIDIQMCFAQYPCPVHGNWSEWAVWGPCLAEPCRGERGSQTRTRTCTNPQPRFGGDVCTGDSTQTQECFNNFGCPVDGGWCEWTNYTSCMLSDKGMFRRRIRDCACPRPASGGAICEGTDFEVETCSSDGQPCLPSEGSGFIDDEDC